MFQHTAARRRLVSDVARFRGEIQFQHTAARRRLGDVVQNGNIQPMFQHTAARRRLVRAFTPVAPLIRFQHTAARRRLASITACPYLISDVSTHSRPKAAGFATITLIRVARGSFNTQPPEGGWETEIFVMFGRFVSTHSRPKAAGPSARFRAYTRPFQHTAARRRLGHRRDSARMRDRFNTQPPEGGWRDRNFCDVRQICFNTQPPEGGWNWRFRHIFLEKGFNTQPPEGGWVYPLFILV